MNEDAVRTLVRELIARHLSALSPGSSTFTGPSVSLPGSSGSRLLPLAWHSSHARYAVASGEELEGPCFIEPAVRCNHCGYCQSHGH
jgi:hypothetical protein